jgi:hypothetical protein
MLTTVRASLLLALAMGLVPQALQAQQPNSSAPALKKEIETFAPLQGKWSCQGVFPSSGKKIESQIAFAPDLDGAWLVKRHDDLPPQRLPRRRILGFRLRRQTIRSLHLRQLWRRPQIHVFRLERRQTHLARRTLPIRSAAPRAPRLQARQPRANPSELGSQTRRQRLGHRRHPRLQKVNNRRPSLH